MHDAFVRLTTRVPAPNHTGFGTPTSELGFTSIQRPPRQAPGPRIRTRP